MFTFPPFPKISRKLVEYVASSMSEHHYILLHSNKLFQWLIGNVITYYSSIVILPTSGLCVFILFPVLVQRCKCYPVDVSTGLHMSTINTKVREGVLETKLSPPIFAMVIHWCYQCCTNVIFDRYSNNQLIILITFRNFFVKCSFMNDNECWYLSLSNKEGQWVQLVIDVVIVK